MRRFSSLAIVVVLVACQKTPRVEPVRQHTNGDFSYQMHVGGTVVAGEFSIAGDTVDLEAAEHGCRRLNPGIMANMRSASFACSGQAAFQVVVDMYRPAFSRWTSTRPETRKRQVCDRWVVTEKGERVCSVNRTEIYTENVVVGGRLQVTQITASDKP